MVSEFMKAQEFDFTEHIVRRAAYRWGSFGKNGGEPQSTNLVKNLSNNHIYNIIRTQALSQDWLELLTLELCYRINYLVEDDE